MSVAKQGGRLEEMVLHKRMFFIFDIYVGRADVGGGPGVPAAVEPRVVGDQVSHQQLTAVGIHPGLTLLHMNPLRGDVPPGQQPVQLGRTSAGEVE